jgi:hypothetical protein
MSISMQAEVTTARRARSSLEIKTGPCIILGVVDILNTPPQPGSRFLKEAAIPAFVLLGIILVGISHLD